MTDFAIYVHEVASTGQPINRWLKSYDADGHDGQGAVEFADTFAEAQHFGAIAKALELSMTVPKSRPVRMDGRPNRPLRAFTIEIRRSP